MDETHATTPSNTASAVENSKTTDKSLPKSASTHRHSLSNGSHTHKRTLSFVPENEKLSNETSGANDGHHRVSSLQNNVEDVWSRRPSIGDNFAHQSDDDDDADWGISDDTNFKPVPRTPHTAGRCFCSKCKTPFGSTLSPSASVLSLSGLANSASNTNPNANHHSALHRSHSRESTSSAALSIAASDRDLYATAMSGAGSVAQTPPHRTPASTPHHHHHHHQHQHQHHQHQYHSPHTPHTPHTTPTPSNLAHDFMERWKQRAAANNNACTVHHQHGHSCVHHRLQLSQTQSSSSHTHTNTAHTHHLSTVSTTSTTSTVSASSHSNMYPPASHSQSHGAHHHAHTQSQPPLIHAHSLPSQPPPFSSSVSTSSSTGSGVAQPQYPYPGPHLLRLHSEESVASTHSLSGFYDGSGAVPATSLSTVPTSPTSTSLQPARGVTTNVTLVASSSPRRSLTASAPTAESLGSLGVPLSSPCCHHQHNHHSRGSFCGSDDSTAVADKTRSAAGTDNHHVVIIDTVNSSYDSSLLPGGANNYETCSCSCACASAGDRTPRKLGDESTDTGTGTGTATEEEEDEDWDQEIEMEQSVTPKIITPRGSIMDPEKHARTLLTDLDADTVGLNKRYLQRIALPLLRMETHKFFAELHSRYKKICEEFRLFPVKYYQVLIDGLRRNRELASVDAMKRDFDAYIQKMDGQMQKIKDDISGGIAPLDSVASKARYAQLCEFRDLLEEFSVGFNVNTAATRTMDALPTTSSNAEGNRVLISLLRAFDILIDSEAGSKIDVARLSLSYQRLANTFLENHHIQEQKWKRDE